ncbi:ABC transporter substrate-binding protein [Entomomonas sp. E2T0]|uniref:ABC transporter substrate-binding protein n=1 Tax=Entomomonas sp. E2T0 TaxID=2930213 RepID=UPI002228500D|nr:ABC transporter substrate-binding protein [Entomomonas sp. E2T0]UYZ83395.1 ABC transporter substrate-binding protein [Entomomonas sp. E2T0]
MWAVPTVFKWSKLLLVGVLWLSSYSNYAADFPVQVVDAMGRTVVMQQAPQRIVTVFSSNTEIVAALGLSKLIIGIDGYTYYPDSIKDVPKIGGRLGFSLDSIVAQSPDLVIMTPARQATHQLIPALDKLGVTSLVVNGGSIDTILQNILLIAKITGVPKTGEQLVASIQQRLKAVSKLSHCPKVILITGRVGNGLLLVARRYASSVNAYTADIVLKAGGCLVLDENSSVLPQLNQVSPEVILATDPDIILFAGSDTELAELSKGVVGWGELKAVKTGFVRAVSRAELLISGPRVIDGVESLSTIFQQWDKQ